MNSEVVNALRTLGTAAGGWLLGTAVPVVPYAWVCTLMVVADTVTSWRLGRRVASEKGTGDSGKLRSDGLWGMLGTLTRVYALLLLGHAVEVVILEPDWNFGLTRGLAAAVCLGQGLSMLENEASCRGSRWAEIARKWLMDKTERHL